MAELVLMLMLLTVMGERWGGGGRWAASVCVTVILFSFFTATASVDVCWRSTNTASSEECPYFLRGEPGGEQLHLLFEKIISST